MKVNVIRGGDLAANAFLYGVPDPGVINYLQAGIQKAAEVTGNMGRSFIESAKAIYDRFNSSSAINAAKALLYNVTDHMGGMTIQHLTVDNYKPNIIMQRYIMCQPEIANLYKQNMCNGFQDSYIDLEPNTYGKERFEYDLIMDGVLQLEQEDPYMIHTSQTLYDDLESLDQFAILNTWDTVANMLANGKDPTDLDIE